jgi:hypothetical protein
MTLDVYADLFDNDLDALADRMDAASNDFLTDYARTRPAVVGIDGNCITV